MIGGKVNDASTKTGSEAQDPTTLKRGRGRPPASDPSGTDLRELLIAAATEVYAEHGYHNSSVALILNSSGVSRPTFYRHFKDRREVIEVVVARVNDELRDIAWQNMAKAKSLTDLVAVTVEGYFSWAQANDSLMGSIYREIHDPESPASMHRDRILEDFIRLFGQAMVELGRKPLDPMVYDALLRVVEHVGHQSFWPRRESTAQRQRRKQVIERILLASLASPAEAALIPSLQSLQLDL